MRGFRAFSLFALLILSGCAVGNTVDFNASKPNVSTTTDKVIVVVALDQRPYVISGDKDPSFVGIRRGGFGNPFDVNTRSGSPLAHEVAKAVVDALTAAGASATSVAVAASADATVAVDASKNATADRRLIVLVREWKSDLYMNMEVDYNLTAQVFDATGKLVAEKTEAGNDRLGPANFESEVSRAASSALQRKLEALLNDPAIAGALQ